MEKIFYLHPDKKTVYQTSDGYFFWELPKAEAHASSLTDKSIETIHKPTEVELPIVVESLEEAVVKVPEVELPTAKSSKKTKEA